MRAFIGLLGVLLTLAIGQFVYRAYWAGPDSATLGTSNIRAAADITGVKHDLLAMANAERAFMAQNGRYATLEDLYASGDLTVDPSGIREGYAYSASVGENNFQITATYTGGASGMPTLSINQSMQIVQR
jgi:hypothetical protein